MEIKKKEIVESIDTGLLFLDTKSNVQITEIVQSISSSVLPFRNSEELGLGMTVFDPTLGNVDICIRARAPHEIKNLETLIDSIQQLNKG